MVTGQPIPTVQDVEYQEQIAAREEREVQSRLCDELSGPLRELFVSRLSSKGCSIDKRVLPALMGEFSLDLENAMYRVDLGLLLDVVRPDFEAAGWTIEVRGWCSPPGEAVSVFPRKEVEIIEKGQGCNKQKRGLFHWLFCNK